MWKLLAVAAATVTVLSATQPTRLQPPAPDAQKPIRVAMMCFKTGEQVSGLNKICYYNCAGSEAAITVGSAQLCPLNINR